MDSRIESYSFGAMKINGTTYTDDLIVFPDRIQENWRRKTGHKLELSDMHEAVAEKPDILIIGQGASGRMKVPQDLQEKVRDRGIEILIAETDDAVELYNKSAEEKKVIGVFHLTC